MVGHARGENKYLVLHVHEVTTRRQLQMATMLLLQLLHRGIVGNAHGGRSAVGDHRLAVGCTPWSDTVAPRIGATRGTTASDE